MSNPRETEIPSYEGSITREFLAAAIKARNKYQSDKGSLIMRIRDNEKLYNKLYNMLSHDISKEIQSDTSFIFSSIENAVADASENYPVPNILAREQYGKEAADALSELFPTLLKRAGFYRVFKKNARKKHKLGTGIYGVFFNEHTNDIDIKSIDIFNIDVDMNVEDIQDSDFLFISALVSNDVLKNDYPEYKALFTGNATQQTASDSYEKSDHTMIYDCYYKKDGILHMMKLCDDVILDATEDMDGYEEGLYRHGKYPVVFDVLYPVDNCPFGFGMLDIAKKTQHEIDLIGAGIDENLLVGAKPRYFAKKSSGVDEDEFRDIKKSIVHTTGDLDGIKSIDPPPLNTSALTYRETKKDELKEMLANRDFQQGATAGGVTAASAIQTLQQAGEKRSRSQMKDTYQAFEDISYMAIELIRQFYYDKRSYRIEDKDGQEQFIEFSNEIMSRAEYVEDEHLNLPEGISADYAIGHTPTGHWEWHPIEFDIDVIPQRDSPYTKEAQNNTILTLFSQGMFSPQNIPMTIIALRNMYFDGRSKLIADLQQFRKEQEQQSAAAVQNSVPASDEALVPVNINAENRMQQAEAADIPEEEEVIPIDITGGV